MKFAMQVALSICFATGCLADEPTQQGSSTGDGDSTEEATGTSADELTSSGETANHDDSKLMPGIADAVSMPHGCGQPIVSSDSHSLTVLCSSGHGSRYKITADACTTSNCVKVGSDIVNYGTTAKVTSGGYVTASSVTVYWYTASGSTPCAYSKLGNTVSWCDMNQNIRDWAARHPSYDESGHTIPNWYKDKRYRPDCSGTVAMAWHMSTNTLNTDSLLDSAYTKSITYSQLKPGDILDYVKGDYKKTHHVVIFAGWSSDHTSGTNGHFSVWTFGYGTFANDSGHHETNDSFSGDVAGHKATDYTPRRYVHAD